MYLRRRANSHDLENELWPWGEGLTDINLRQLRAQPSLCQSNAYKYTILLRAYP